MTAFFERKTYTHLVLLLILACGAGLRFHAVMQPVRFHPDEALFATFARNAAVHGDWMLSGALDKSPLSLYAAALSMHAVGVTVTSLGVLDIDRQTGEFAARLPNVYAGVLLIALSYALAAAGADRRAGVVAAAWVAFSPQLIAFSATAFTDMLMVAFGMAALVCAARGRGAWTGVWLAAAIWSKQQGVFYLPAALMLLLMTAAPRVVWLRLCVTVATGVGLLLLWDAARPETSLFAVAAVNNDPTRVFVQFDEILPRVRTWWTYFSGLFGAEWLAALVLILALIAPHARRLRPASWGLLAFCAGYLLMLVGVAFNLYDRYLLVILPVLAVVLAVRMTTYWAAAVCGLLLLTLVQAPPTYPTDTRARDAEIIALADWLNAQSLGAIVYDHWLGWEMGYYRGAWSDKRWVYYPTPDALATDALLNPDPAPRYWIAPDPVPAHSPPLMAWLDALQQRGFAVSLAYRTPHYGVYQVLPP